MTALKIIHTSDLHGKLNQRRAEALSFWREQSGALLLDSGDAISAGNVYVRPGREPAIELMNLAGYQAMAVGNREYFFRKRGLLKKTAQAKFVVLSANLLPRESGIGHLQRWTALDTGAGRVGLFGLTPTMIVPGSWVERFSDLRFVPWQEAAREAVEALQAEADWLVALSHLGHKNDLRLARICPELDIILGGHSHVIQEETIVEAGIGISHAGHHASHAALIDLTREGDGETHIERRLLDLG